MTDQPKVLSQFTLKRIIWPILIGLGFIIYLIIKDFDKESLKTLEWTWTSNLWLLMAVGMGAVRHIAYMYRIRLLTDWKLDLWQSFIFILLWEFASAATPSIVGGAAFAIFLLIKEGVSPGKTTSIVLLTGFLDELFFMLIAPIGFLLAGLNNIFPNDGPATDSAYFYFALIGYSILLAYTLLLAYGLLINPRGFKFLIVKLFSVRFLRKWYNDAVEMGDDIITASTKFRGETKLFWAKNFGATVLSWSARFLQVNCLILAFTTVKFQDQFIIYARQVVVWILMLVTPTPGGSGTAEFAFTEFLNGYIPVAYAAPMALLWRLLSYYPYLILGVIVLPRWIRRIYGKKFPENAG